jgi:hypothetical protein
MISFPVVFVDDPQFAVSFVAYAMWFVASMMPRSTNDVDDHEDQSEEQERHDAIAGHMNLAGHGRGSQRAICSRKISNSRRSKKITVSNISSSSVTLQDQFLTAAGAESNAKLRETWIAHVGPLTIAHPAVVPGLRLADIAVGQLRYVDSRCHYVPFPWVNNSDNILQPSTLALPIDD